MNWIFAKQIRSRLTVWYVAVLALILAVYIVMVFVFQSRTVSSQIFHDEVQDVETVEGLLYFDNHGVLLLKQDYFSQPHSHLLIDRLMEVYDLSGTVLYRTPNLNGASLGGPLLFREGQRGFNRRVVTLPDRTQVSLISHIHAMAGRTLIIRLGYSLTPFRERMTQFLGILLIAFPVALVIAGFAGYLMARRAFRPLEEMAQKAQRITAENLHARLDVENADDELGHMAVIFNDLLNRLEQAFRQLNRFTADAAHELRAPMAAIRTLGEVSLRNEANESDREAIASILEEAARLDETISGLLLLAKAEAAQPEGPDRFSLIEVTAEVLTLLEVLGDERGIRFVTRIETSAEFAVAGDRSLIRGAVMNVVHNAIKFSPSGSVITLVHSAVEKPLPGIQLTVEDQGPGIDSTEQETVFERFYTGKRPEISASHGAGLGLSIAKLVIQRSGGSIAFDQNYRSGTRCILRLPAYRKSDSPG